MKVLWLDPGGTTGWACARLTRGVKVIDAVRETMQVGQVSCGLGEPMESAHAWELLSLIADINDHGDDPLDVVGFEDFRLFPGQEHSPDMKGTLPMRLLAKIDMLWWMATDQDVGLDDYDLLPYGPGAVPKLVKQMPGERSIVTDALLKRWGLWRTEKRQGGGQHAMDALRHLIVFGRKWVEGKVDV